MPARGANITTVLLALAALLAQWLPASQTCAATAAAMSCCASARHCCCDKEPQKDPRPTPGMCDCNAPLAPQPQQAVLLNPILVAAVAATTVSEILPEPLARCRMVPALSATPPGTGPPVYLSQHRFLI
jgi:hypothetical protein